MSASRSGFSIANTNRFLRVLHGAPQLNLALHGYYIPNITFHTSLNILRFSDWGHRNPGLPQVTPMLPSASSYGSKIRCCINRYLFRPVYLFKYAYYILP